VASLQPGNTLDGWVAHADAALYRSKQEGRNRVSAT
jgi:PleD family two-component response regulator